MEYRKQYQSIFYESINTDNFTQFQKGLKYYFNSPIEEAYVTFIDNVKRKTISQGMTTIKILPNKIELAGSINGIITNNNFVEVDYESGQAVIELKGNKTLVIE